MTVLCSEGSTTTRVPSFPTFVIHADGENDPQYALSKPKPDTMLAAWKNWRSTKVADSRTGAQGRTRARNNALWTVLAVLMMESINEEKTLLLIPQY